MPTLNGTPTTSARRLNPMHSLRGESTDMQFLLRSKHATQFPSRRARSQHTIMAGDAQINSPIRIAFRKRALHPHLAPCCIAAGQRRRPEDMEQEECPTLIADRNLATAAGFKRRLFMRPTCSW